MLGYSDYLSNMFCDALEEDNLNMRLRCNGHELFRSRIKFYQEFLGYSSFLHHLRNDIENIQQLMDQGWKAIPSLVGDQRYQGISFLDENFGANPRFDNPIGFWETDYNDWSTIKPNQIEPCLQTRSAFESCSPGTASSVLQSIFLHMTDGNALEYRQAKSISMQIWQNHWQESGDDWRSRRSTAGLRLKNVLIAFSFCIFLELLGLSNTEE